MPKVVISGYYGFDNFGDEAILSVLTDCLTGKADVTVFSANPEKTAKEYFVNSVQTFDYARVSNAIMNSDVLISGGGSLLQDVTSAKSLIYYCWVIMMAQLCGKKTAIFAQGIGPLEHFGTRFLVKSLLKKCDYISVRDEESQQLLEQWGIKSELLCDPIYSLNFEPVGKRCSVGVQLRDFKIVNNKFLHELAEAVAQNFAHKVIEVYSLQDAIDLDVCRKFVAHLHTINPNIEAKIVSSLSVHEAIEKISGLEYMIGMRFHALLVALKCGVKSLAINYDPKVQKLAQEHNMPLIETNNYGDYTEKFAQLISSAVEPIQKEFDWGGLETSLNSIH